MAKQSARQAVGAGNVTPLRPPKPCPICGKTSQRAFHPFCSARCADIDLNRWLTGRYVIPARPEEDAQEPETTPADYRPEDDEGF